MTITSAPTPGAAAWTTTPPGPSACSLRTTPAAPGCTPNKLLPFHLDSTAGMECTDDLTHDWGPWPQQRSS